MSTAVLIVEDSAVLQEVLRSTLSSEDYRCFFASSCAEAKRLLESQVYACALIDLGLPDGNGLDILPLFKQHNPWGVPVILTAQMEPDTIIEALRAGAYDYLIKPVNTMGLQAAVNRATQHHCVLQERDELFSRLEEERRQLQKRVEQATEDIRHYANHCETVNARLGSLLRLAETCGDFYTDENLFRAVLDELIHYLPVECIVFSAPGEGDFITAVPGNDGETRVIASRWPDTDPADEDAQRFILECLELFTEYDPQFSQVFLYPQVFGGRTVCNVAFFLSSSYPVDGACDEFLSMCAHLLASEWQEAQLFLYTTKMASLGKIAMEISRNLIQGLTAIRTSADAIGEMKIVPDAHEGLKIICTNVENLQRQIEEFRQLAMPKKDAIMTVDIIDYINQALEMLSMSIRSRQIQIEKDFSIQGQCMLLNVSALSWTLVDLISNAVHAVAPRGRIVLRLSRQEPDSVAFDVVCEGIKEMAGERQVSDPRLHPNFFLAQRAIRSCGGGLSVEISEGSWCYRVVLPHDPTRPHMVEVT